MRRRRVAWASVIIVVVVVVLAWAIILPGGDKTASSTTTSTTRVPSSAATSTTSSAATTTSTAAPPAKPTLTYSAQLTGESEIPALSTPASGTFTLTVAPGAPVHYVLEVRTITDVTVARLRTGKAGATGALLLTIYAGPTKSGVFNGTLTQGSFTAAKLEGPLKGKTIADLVALVKAGSVYLNVGTSAHPRGEIRGQLE